MRKILLYLLLTTIFVLSFSDEITINLLGYEEGEFEYMLTPVLDSDSKNNLPFLLFSFDKNLSNVHIDSFLFLNEGRTDDFKLESFEGNIPLSLPAPALKKNEPALFSEKILFQDDARSLRVHPFRYNGKYLTFFRKVKIFYTAYPNQGVKNSPVYDYLIVCHADYDTAFERLKMWKEQRGLKTRIITTDSIFTYSTGRDSAEKLRNFIKNEYTLYGFKYLLLGGDRATIPVRRMFAMDCNAEYYADEDSIPADIYYSNLDKDFDFDNDGIFGEVEDSSDLTQEILAGRILFDTIYYGPSPIITRIIDYEKTKNIEQLNRGIFMGMILWNPPFTSGGEAKEMIFNDIIPPSFHVLKFYEHLGHSGKLDILDSLDMGYGIVNHNGHGSFKGIWVDTLTSLSRGDMTGLTNDSKTGLFYSIGCWVGAFDRDNTTYNLHSITQNMQNSPTGGYISIITNSRYGWGAPGYPGYGVSDVLDYRFFEMLFSDSVKEPAYILKKLKEEYAPLSSEENLYRWHQYQLNYFGDPSTSIYTGSPDSLFISYRKYDSELYIYASYKTGAPAGNMNVCIFKDTIISRGATDANGLFIGSISGLDDSIVCVTVTGTMATTFIDSLNLASYGKDSVIIFCDTLYSGAKNNIRIVNPSSASLSILVKSSFIDTTVTAEAGETLNLNYSPVFSKENVDILTFRINETMETETVYAKVLMSVISFDSLRFDNTLFKTSLKSNHDKIINNMNLRVLVYGTDTILDTLLTGDFLSRENFSEATGIPPGLDYITAEAILSKDDTLLCRIKSYMNNGEYSFLDDFNADLSKWEYSTSYWNINTNEQLYAGEESGYLNYMNDTLVSKDFFIYPGSVCSLYVDAYLPSLEFIGTEPVFDLDGLFIRMINNENDTATLDFISSGGALKSIQSMQIKGWREYFFKNESPVSSKIFLNFISDSVITDSGIYISCIKVHPPFYYAESTSITRDDKNVIGRDNVKYSLTGLLGKVTAEIITIDGRVIRRYNFNDAASAVISFEGVPSGVYFVVFRAGKAKFKDKLIILK
ncbi:MAG: C25 family cysteine peptidase [bacterium]